MQVEKSIKLELPLTVLNNISKLVIDKHTNRQYVNINKNNIFVNIYVNK